MVEKAEQAQAAECKLFNRKIKIEQVFDSFYLFIHHADEVGAKLLMIDISSEVQLHFLDI
jgi:hypothetical protein